LSSPASLEVLLRGKENGRLIGALLGERGTLRIEERQAEKLV